MIIVLAQIILYSQVGHLLTKLLPKITKNARNGTENRLSKSHLGWNFHCIISAQWHLLRAFFVHNCLRLLLFETYIILSSSLQFEEVLYICWIQRVNILLFSWLAIIIFNLHSLASQQDYLNNQWNNYNNDNDNTIKCRNNMNSEKIRVPDGIWTRFPPLFSSVVRSGRVGGQIQCTTLLLLFLFFWFFFQVHVISTFTRNIHNIISAQWYLPLYILIFQ